MEGDFFMRLMANINIQLDRLTDQERSSILSYGVDLVNSKKLVIKPIKWLTVVGEVPEIAYSKILCDSKRMDKAAVFLKTEGAIHFSSDEAVYEILGDVLDAIYNPDKVDWDVFEGRIVEQVDRALRRKNKLVRIAEIVSEVSNFVKPPFDRIVIEKGMVKVVKNKKTYKFGIEDLSERSLKK
jgi:hypothetical protein